MLVDDMCMLGWVGWGNDEDTNAWTANNKSDAKHIQQRADYLDVF